MKAELDEIHGTSASSFKIVNNWLNEFKRGRTSTRDEPRSGRPVEAATPEVEKIHDIISSDQRVKVREIFKAINISHGTAITILQEKVSMKNLLEILGNFCVGTLLLMKLGSISTRLRQRNSKNSGQPSPPGTQDCGCRPRCNFYWPSLSPRSARPSSSLAFITRVTNDSISIHFCSDWSMRETIVPGVSYAPTARPTASLATPHLAQTKSVCSALSTRDPQ